MAKKTLSSVDTAWLRMEDPTNLMMVTGVLVFATPMNFERLKATIELVLTRFDRFRQRVVRPALGLAYWEEDPDFDINYHLQRTLLPPPADQTTLQDLTSLLASTPLDLSRPLWQLHLVENYAEGSALICRLHHAIGDGLALVHVLLSLTDTSPDTPWPLYKPRPRPSRKKRLAQSIYRPLRGVVKGTGQLGRQVTQECCTLCTHPARLTDLASLGFRALTATGRLVLLWPDPKTVLKGPLNIPKRTAWSAPIPLQEVKRLGKTLGGTVNDLLLTAMAGGLRRYLLQRGEDVESLNFRAIVPVNLRRPGTEAELGNKFGLVFLALPIGIADPEERLHELKRRMDNLKGSLEAPAAFGILTGIGRSPQPIQDLVVNIFGLKGTAVMTNVIGPKEQIYLAGAPLKALMFWVPQSGHLGLGVSILSYASQVWLGVISDRGLVPDPEAIVTGFQAEFQALQARADQVEAAFDIDDLSARLDQALVTADALLEQKKGSASPEAGRPNHCQALTKAGKPCKNRPLSGSLYCRVHQPRPGEGQ